MRRGTLALAALMASTALAGCSTASVRNLSVGTCFNADSTATELSNVPTVPCEGPHDQEVYFVFDLPSTMTFSETAMTEAGFERCMTEFAGYVGVDYTAPEADDLDIYTLTPNADGWEGGDHEVVCLVGPMVIGEKLTGSVKNARG